MIFLSIIIPVYNAAKTISRCLDSIWSQNLPQEEYEVICVNDCSPDDSVAVLREIQKTHSNLRIESHSVNLRAGGSRNTGVRAAQGDYILFIDADDYFHPESLKKAFEYLQKNPDLDILTCNFARELPDSPCDKFTHPYFSKDKLTPAQYLSLNQFVPCSPWQWFFRKTLMTENNIWFRNHTISEDVDWTHQLILKAKLIQYQPILLSHYVIDKGTQTALSYAKPANVYAYMNAGIALYQLRQAYAAIGHAGYITGMARGYIQQGMKYYLAMFDRLSEKVRHLKEMPAELTLSGYCELFRRMPLFYALLTNCICPFTRIALKIKAKYSFRGIRIK